VRVDRVIATAASVIALAAPAANAKPTEDHAKTTTMIAQTISATWACQDQRGVARTKGHSPWSLPKSRAYRAWVLDLWQHRRASCARELHAHDATIENLNAGIARFYREAGAGGVGPMSGLGATIERVGRRYHVSPYFVVAAAATESSIGLAACSNNHMNVWGLSSCGSGWYVPSWRSWDEALAFYARFLTSHWPGATSTYSYRGYARCSDCWGAKVAQHMSHLFGVGNSVRY
jgi:hypothetical protein